MNDQPRISAQEPDVREDNVLAISHTMTRMRIMIGRRVIGRMAIAKLAPGLELSHIDVLDVVKRATGDVTVGAIADSMRIDPSRGSRVVAEMVGRGLLQREVSQEDGRRSIIGVTPLGESILAEMRDAKIGIIRDVVGDWAEDDIASFARLYDRFVDRFEKRLTPDANSQCAAARESEAK
ncbi:MarR family winged helix-turn-helix transcriptional regulator [Agrobacterium larrymoorei]|uniref:MarR family transcriptional regulator n=2 Tax=Agrobacterium TaxID=357 RepID=A0A4D7DSV7_9HYPH|nr:MarR family transcriptional regulator [Agrobacterium larrymoorei]QYA06084.1 MarR family transcriptional regulator [Agrobacterium larrymoorei]